MGKTANPMLMFTSICTPPPPFSVYNVRNLPGSFTHLTTIHNSCKKLKSMPCKHLKWNAAELPLPIK